MNPCNAIIKSYGIRTSEQWYQCLELWMELSLQNGGSVVFSTYGVFEESWTKNQFGYAVKRVLDIVGVEKLENIKGKPIRAKFKEDGRLGDIIIGIGNFLSEDWFIPKEEELWKEKNNN